MSPPPPNEPAQVQAAAIQGWARSPASERGSFRMPVGTASDTKGGAGTHSNYPSWPRAPRCTAARGQHGWGVMHPDPLPCCRGPSNPHTNPRRQVPISGIYVPSVSTVFPQTMPDIQQDIMRLRKKQAKQSIVNKHSNQN